MAWLRFFSTNLPTTLFPGMKRKMLLTWFVPTMSHIRRVAPLKDAQPTERLRHCLSFLESSSGNRGLTRPRRAAAASDSGKNSPIGFRFEKILDVESRKRKTQFRFFVQIEKFREKKMKEKSLKVLICFAVLFEGCVVGYGGRSKKGEEHFYYIIFLLDKIIPLPWLQRETRESPEGTLTRWTTRTA